MSKIIKAIGKAVGEGVTRVVGGVLSAFTNLFPNSKTESNHIKRDKTIRRWESSAQFTGCIKTKYYEDLTNSAIYFHTFNKSKENTLTVAVIQGKAVGCKPEMYVYSNDLDTSNIEKISLPSTYNVKDLKEMFN